MLILVIVLALRGNKSGDWGRTMRMAREPRRTNRDISTGIRGEVTTRNEFQLVVVQNVGSV
jgi:hypothetical protein